MDDAKKVRVIFVRHFYSCANLLKQSTNALENPWYAGKNWYRRKRGMVDPHITPGWANSHSQAVSRQVELALTDGRHGNALPPLVVMASPLMRSIETARLLFPSETIVLMPYAAEHGSGKDNTLTATPGEQQERLRGSQWGRTSTYALPNRVSYENVTHGVSWTTGAGQSDFGRFKAELEKKVFRQLEEKRAQSLTVVVVTHHKFMHKSLFRQSDVPYDNIKNGAVVVQDFIVRRIGIRKYLDAHHAPILRFSGFTADVPTHRTQRRQYARGCDVLPVQDELSAEEEELEKLVAQKRRLNDQGRYEMDRDYAHANDLAQHLVREANERDRAFIGHTFQRLPLRRKTRK